MGYSVCVSLYLAAESTERISNREVALSLVYLLLLFHSLKSNLSEILNSPWYMICWARRCIEWSESDQRVSRSGEICLGSCQVLSQMVRCRVSVGVEVVQWSFSQAHVKSYLWWWDAECGGVEVVQWSFSQNSPLILQYQVVPGIDVSVKSGKSSVVRIMLSAAHNSLCLSQNCSVTDIRGSCNNS